MSQAVSAQRELEAIARDGSVFTLRHRLRAAGLRVDADLRNEKKGCKIRDGQQQKIPCMLIVGDREAEAGSVSVRSRFEEDPGASGVDEFAALVQDPVKNKAVRP